MTSTTLMNISIIVAGINIILIVNLLNVYIKNFNQIRSTYTAGLLLFATLFLIQNLVFMYYGFTMAQVYAEGVGFFLLIFTFLQALAFAVLNWITLK